ncbi:MAG: hypothetical protein MRT15_04290 [archaeon YNP-LCB-003-016]|uniref:hypothetical protein n=1 Tax=Candidatus Culexarchaeum yellowstonense TaxID=2928963 RepID=UPI0026EA2CAD|nr:hypothetical protein [Candidatus Culexarchaeum yellowstonense]MCR6691588.1 hypothetical protein [Candidatus Culexarchaeum yellowstonense]
MSTAIITKTKVSIGAIEPSTLTISIDVNMPGGTTARLEVSTDRGYIQPGIFTLTTEPEVQGEVYVLLDGTEVKLLELDEDSMVDVDVNEDFGEILTKKIILVGKAKTKTTAIRKITLKYSGGIFEYR